MTQCEAILIHLKNFRFITPADAYEFYGVMRLSARIHDLRRAGVKIETIRKTGKNRYGNTVNYAEYRLIS